MSFRIDFFGLWVLIQWVVLVYQHQKKGTGGEKVRDAGEGPLDGI